MNQHEIDILNKLSAQAAEPSDSFTENLRQRLINREQILKTDVMPIRRQIMNYKILIAGAAALLVLVVGGVLALVSLNKDDNGQTKLVTPNSTSNTSTTQTSSLPNQQANNLEEAKESLSFEPLLPSTKLNNESLSDIKVGTKSNMFDDSDTLYLTYKDAQGTLYKVSESTKKFNYPTEVKKVTLIVGGKQISANYYLIPEFEENSGPTSAGGDVTAPRSYVFWSNGGVNYEVSEFGRVSQQQLIQVANSLK